MFTETFASLVAFQNEEEDKLAVNYFNHCTDAAAPRLVVESGLSEGYFVLYVCASGKVPAGLNLSACRHAFMRFAVSSLL